MCLSSFQGIFISRVNKGGAAEKAGIHVGDRLLEVGRESFFLDWLYSLRFIYNSTDTARGVTLMELEVTPTCCTLLLPAPCWCSSCDQWRASSDQQTALGWDLPHLQKHLSPMNTYWINKQINTPNQSLQSNQIFIRACGTVLRYLTWVKMTTPWWKNTPPFRTLHTAV